MFVCRLAESGQPRASSLSMLVKPPERFGELTRDAIVRSTAIINSRSRSAVGVCKHQYEVLKIWQPLLSQWSRLYLSVSFLLYKPKAKLKDCP